MLLGAAWSAFHLGDFRRAPRSSPTASPVPSTLVNRPLEVWGRNLLAVLAWHAGDADRIVTELEASRVLSGPADPALSMWWKTPPRRARPASPPPGATPRPPSARCAGRPTAGAASAASCSFRRPWPPWHAWPPSPVTRLRRPLQYLAPGFTAHRGAAARAASQARHALGGDGFARAWEQGQALALDDAVAYAASKGGGRKRPATGWASLTPAELEVVRLVSEGLRNDAIARRLFIAPGTVKVHLTHIFAKLGITTRTELAAKAAAQDLTAR